MTPLFIDTLSVAGLRNLAAARIALHPQGNLFYGLNGSGKTSLLEALHLLAVGRSFRSHQIRPLIAHTQDHCLVQASLQRGGGRHALGMERHRSGEVSLRVNGAVAQSHTQLAALLPVVLLDTESLELVFGPPENRRRYIDGTLFHVEQSFLDVWRRYQRVLRQRNAGLRHGTMHTDEVWLDELARTGELLHGARAAILKRLNTWFGRIAGLLSPSLSDVDLEMRRGWDVSLTLCEALDRSSASDRERGFSQVGPHRADLRIRVGGRQAAEYLSRGQSKLILTALKLAQGHVVAEVTASPPVYLVDDIIAELDAEHAERVCSLLAEQGGQVCMTAVDEAALRRFWPNSACTMFHVEQGLIQLTASQ